MFEQIRRLLRHPETQRGGGLRVADPRIAAAALLVHVAEADGAFTAAESTRLRALLSREFGIGEREASVLLEDGRRADADAIDLFGFTSILVNQMDIEGRRAFVDLLWTLIYADGGVHELEDNLAWRICELLGIPTEERMMAKRAAAQRAGLSVAPV